MVHAKAPSTPTSGHSLTTPQRNATLPPSSLQQLLQGGSIKSIFSRYSRRSANDDATTATEIETPSERKRADQDWEDANKTGDDDDDSTVEVEKTSVKSVKSSKSAMSDKKTPTPAASSKRRRSKSRTSEHPSARRSNCEVEAISSCVEQTAIAIAICAIVVAIVLVIIFFAKPGGEPSDPTAPPVPVSWTEWVWDCHCPDLKYMAWRECLGNRCRSPRRQTKVSSNDCDHEKCNNNNACQRNISFAFNSDRNFIINASIDTQCAPRPQSMIHVPNVDKQTFAVLGHIIKLCADVYNITGEYRGIELTLDAVHYSRFEMYDNDANKPVTCKIHGKLTSDRDTPLAFIDDTVVCLLLRSNSSVEALAKKKKDYDEK